MSKKRISPVRSDGLVRFARRLAATHIMRVRPLVALALAAATGLVVACAREKKRGFWSLSSITTVLYFTSVHLVSAPKVGLNEASICDRSLVGRYCVWW